MKCTAHKPLLFACRSQHEHSSNRISCVITKDPVKITPSIDYQAFTLVNLEASPARAFAAALLAVWVGRPGTFLVDFFISFTSMAVS